MTLRLEKYPVKHFGKRCVYDHDIPSQTNGPFDTLTGEYVGGSPWSAKLNSRLSGR